MKPQLNSLLLRQASGKVESNASAAGRSPGERGFTLTELMVAITGGLFVSIAVFSLARFGSSFYQQETRIANATMTSIVGFERLKADISRAGFLASPNVLHDPAVCGQPATDPSWPVELKRMAGIRIDRDFLTGHAVLDTPLNGSIKPDAITIAGSFDSGDEFPIRMVTPGGSGGYDVYLQVLSGPMTRLGTANLGSVFKPGRGLRIVDEAGKHQYGTITGTSFNSGQPIVHLSATPTLVFRSGGSQACGFKGFETGGLANVVNFVRYELRDIQSDTNHQALFADTSEAILADDSRVELVRVELDTSGSEIVESLELVAEFAVDLAFGVTASAISLGDGHQTLETALPNTAQVSNIAGEISAAGTVRPQHVRSVRTRLSIRSRQADRTSNIPSSTFVAAGLYRIALNPAEEAAAQRWARVRTLQADIALVNQAGATW